MKSFVKNGKEYPIPSRRLSVLKLTTTLAASLLACMTLRSYSALFAAASDRMEAVWG